MIYRPFARLYKISLLIVIIVPLLSILLAITLLWNNQVTWKDIILLVVMYGLTGLGVSLGYHRMLTHRSFEPHPVVKIVLLLLGATAVEGSALEWAAAHVKHHVYADREGDPHSPVDGLIHAHFGWLFKEKIADPRIYCRHLLNDPIVCFMDRTFFLWVVLSLAIPYGIDGWHGLLWGGLVRLFLVHHVTWSVNSAGHTIGKRPFETKDRSHNLWLLGLLALGDGWHNNHHAFPRSAFHGLRWWQFDLCGYTILLLEFFHLAKHVYRVSPEQFARYAARNASSGKKRQAHMSTSIPTSERKLLLEND